MKKFIKLGKLTSVVFILFSACFVLSALAQNEDFRVENGEEVKGKKTENSRDNAVKDKDEAVAVIVVTGTKTKHRIENTPVETILITSKDIEKSNARNISEIIKSVPGFNFSQQSDVMSAMGYKNTVRGLNIEDRYVLILVDSQRVFSGFRSGGMAGAGFAHNLNVVPVELIERIEVVKGSGSALYGSDAVAGVINIITKKTAKKTLAEAGGSYTLYNVKGKDYLGNTPESKNRQSHDYHATVGGPVTDDVSTMFYFSHSENEGIAAKTYDRHLSYVHGKVDADLFDNLWLRVGGEYINWEEKEKTSGDNKDEDTYRIFTIMDYQINASHGLKLQAYRQNMKCDFRDPVYGKMDADVSYSDAELQYTGEFGDWNTIVFGAEYLREDLKTNRLKKKTINSFSLFLQDELIFMKDRIVILPGVRYDYNSSYGHEVNPKLSIMLKPFENTTMRLSGGRSFKSPLAIQSHAEPANHVAMWIFPNPDLNPEKSWTFQGGIEQWLFAKRLMVSATYFYMNIDDMIAQAATGGTHMGLPVMSFKNINEAEIHGLESMVSLFIIKGLRLDLEYCFTHAEDKSTGKRLINTPSHSFSSSLDYFNSEIGLGGALFVNYASEQDNMTFGSTMAEKTEGFTSIGMNIRKDITDRGILSFEVNNLLDKEMKGSNTIHSGRSFTFKLKMHL